MAGLGQQTLMGSTKSSSHYLPTQASQAGRGLDGIHSGAAILYNLFLGLYSGDICDGALCAPGMLLGMRGILCLSAHGLMISAFSILTYCKMPGIPCAT